MEEEKKSPKKTSLKTEHIIAALVVIVLFLVFVLARGYIARQKEAAYQQGLSEAGVVPETIEVSDEITVTAATLKETIAAVNKLTTLEYVYTNVGVYEKSDKLFNTNISLPFTTDKTLYTYSGKISYGVDFKDVSFDVDNERKIITVHYSAPTMLSHDMDQGFEFYDIKKAVFNKSDFNDFEEFRTNLKADLEKKLMEDSEFMSNVKVNTEKAVESILTASGQIDDYVLIHEWK